jgi:hypothetical protein
MARDRGARSPVRGSVGARGGEGSLQRELGRVEGLGRASGVGLARQQTADDLLALASSALAE